MGAHLHEARSHSTSRSDGFWTRSIGEYSCPASSLMLMSASSRQLHSEWRGALDVFDDSPPEMRLWNLDEQLLQQQL